MPGIIALLTKFYTKGLSMGNLWLEPPASGEGIRHAQQLFTETTSLSGADWRGALRQFESELLALGERLDDPGVVLGVPGHELCRSSRKEPVGVGLRADVLHLRSRVL